MMRTLEGDNNICVDVDDTLVSWAEADEKTGPQPHPDCKLIEIEHEGRSASYWVYPFNVQSLKTHHQKGHNVIVWSGSGYEWARTVVKALGLSDYVDLVMSKPRWLLDDMLPERFMPTPYWGGGDPGKNKLKRGE